MAPEGLGSGAGALGHLYLVVKWSWKKALPEGTVSPQEKQIREMLAQPGDAAPRPRNAVSSSELYTFARSHRATPPLLPWQLRKSSRVK